MLCVYFCCCLSSFCFLRPMFPVPLHCPFLNVPSVYLQELSPFKSDKLTAFRSHFIGNFNIVIICEMFIVLRLHSNLYIEDTDWNLKNVPLVGICHLYKNSNYMHYSLNGVSFIDTTLLYRVSIYGGIYFILNCFARFTRIIRK